MMINAEQAMEMTNATLAKRETEAQNRAENWVETTCPAYIEEAASAGRTKTKEFKCPNEMSKRIVAIIEKYGYTVKYRSDFELIQIFW